jgi:acetate---CoA ligase (ADP-forming)
MQSISPGGLDALFAPTSIAVIGASGDQRRFGGRPIQYLIEAGFTGPIYPVNPTRTEIQGLPAFADVASVPGPVDCAILAVSAEATEAALVACADKGARAAIIFGAGFSEVGAEGREMQDRVLALGRARGVRLLGPNCMGAFNARARFYGTFASALEVGVPAPGRIGVASQSGGYGGYLLKHLLMRGLGLSQWVTTGNEADVDVGEALAWMAAQAETEILLGYVEGVRSGASLIAALELARELGKPVVMMKVGRTEEGRRAAASHTASLTGEDEVYGAVFEKYGVFRPRTTEEMLDVCAALSQGKALKGPRVGVISISGGVGVQIADYVSDAGLAMGRLPEPAQQALRALVPACSPNNPIDMTGLVTTNHDIMEKTLDVTLASGAFDATIIFLGIAGAAPSMAGPLQQAIANACARHPDQLVAVAVTAEPEMVRGYADRDLLTCEDPSRAVATLAALDHFRRLGDRPPPAAAVVGEAPLLDRALNEAETKALLAAIGIAAPREALAATPETAAAQAAAIGFPVALKIVSPDIAHKTEHGGVRLRLGSAAEVEAAAREMRAAVAARAPGARLDGFLVSEMIEGGVETILGVHRDPAFGPIVTFGLGGVLVELFKDVACALAPVGLDEARAMIGRIRTAPLLTGYRGGPRHDVEALAAAISALSAFAAGQGERLRSLEINPLVVRPGSGGVLALDAAIAL